MTTLTNDQKIVRYGTADGHQPGVQPQKSNTNIYAGTVAVTRGGYLIDPMAAVQTTDVCWGMINGQQDGAPHTVAPMAGGAVDGTHQLDFDTGSFYLLPGTAGDALAQSDVGSTVYLIDGVTVGKTSGSSTRPIAGVLEALGVAQYSGLVAVRLGNNQSTGDV
jgi:hypothetical protein